MSAACASGGSVLGDIEEHSIERGGKKVCPFYTRIAGNFQPSSGSRVGRVTGPLRNSRPFPFYAGNL